MPPRPPRPPRRPGGPSPASGGGASALAGAASDFLPVGMAASIKTFIEAAIPTGKKSEAAPAKADAPPPDAGDGPPGRRGGRGGRGGMGGETPTETYQFVLLCLDRSTGKTLW